MIGAEVLQYATLEIDPANHRVRFLMLGELAGLKTGGNVAALKDGLHWPASTIEVSFCGRTTDMVVDTGSNADLNSRTTLLQRAGCRSAVESDVQSDTLGGLIFAPRSGIADAAVGGVALGPVLAQGVPDSRADALGIDGGIGLGVLSRFVLAIDIFSRRVAFLSAAPESEGIERPTIGLEIRRTRDALEVLHVEGGSPASRSRVKVGDRLCSVDGMLIAALGDRFILNPAPGTGLTLTTCDGRAVAITAADFLFPAGVPRPAPNDVTVTRVGYFTTAFNDCVWGDATHDGASCTAVIDAPPDTRRSADWRIVGYLSRARGEAALGDSRSAMADYRHVLALDPGNAQAKAALDKAGS